MFPPGLLRHIGRAVSTDPALLATIVKTQTKAVSYCVHLVRATRLCYVRYDKLGQFKDAFPVVTNPNSNPTP
jgi:hypothetical protein